MKAPPMATKSDFSSMPYTRVLFPLEEGGYFAEILEFPGCLTEGETAEEALSNLNDVAEAWIEAAEGQGLAIPEPSSGNSYSGRIALRMPQSLHRRSALLAERDGVSLNQFLVSAISAAVGANDMLSLFTREIERRTAPALIFAPRMFQARALTIVHADSTQPVGVFDRSLPLELGTSTASNRSSLHG